jgi:hypothetical protein
MFVFSTVIAVPVLAAIRRFLSATFLTGGGTAKT